MHYVPPTKIDIPDVARRFQLLKMRFGDPDPVGTAKHELYRLFQTNKELDTFLNTFLVLTKKAKFDDSNSRPTLRKNPVTSSRLY